MDDKQITQIKSESSFSQRLKNFLRICVVLYVWNLLIGIIIEYTYYVFFQIFIILTRHFILQCNYLI